MQQYIDELNLPHYDYLKEIIRIYTFFKMSEFDSQIDFTFNEFYTCILNNEPNFLIQHLICCYFEKHIQDFKIPYFTLINDKNRCIRQCLIYNDMFKIFELLQEQYDIQDKLIVPDYQFYDLDVDSKIQGLMMIVNQLASQSKWLNGIIYNKLQILNKCKDDSKSFKQKSSKDLYELTKQQQELQKEEKQILRKKQFMGVSMKKRLKELEKENNDLNEKISKQKQLMCVDIDMLKKFGVNQMKIIHRDEQCCIWIILNMPDYFLVKIEQNYHLLNHDQMAKLIEKFENLTHMADYVNQEQSVQEINNNSKKQNNFKFDQNGLESYLNLRGKKEYLIYCQQVNNLNEIIKKMMLDIEEIISNFFHKYRQTSWNYPKIRKQWRNQILNESDTNFVYTFYNKICVFRSRYYDFSSDEQVPENYMDKRIPIQTYFKLYLSDLQLFENNEYCYVLAFYNKVLIQYKKSEEFIQQKILNEGSKEKDQSNRKSNTLQEEIKQVRKRNKRAIIDDEDDNHDDEDFNIEDYKYK